MNFKISLLLGVIVVSISLKGANQSSLAQKIQKRWDDGHGFDSVEGTNLLKEAIVETDYAVVDMLLKARIGIHRQTNGLSPFHVAAAGANGAIFERLLEEAQYFARYSPTLLQDALLNTNSAGENVLNIAAQNRNNNIFLCLLESLEKAEQSVFVRRKLIRLRAVYIDTELQKLYFVAEE